MSLYRFIRTSALLTLAGRYRSKLFRIVLAVAVAVVTAWLYDDIALFLDRQKPEWLGAALILKTLVVYGALVYAFWQLRPGAWVEPAATAAETRAPPTPGEVAPPEPSPLDELLDKPRLQSRKDAILSGPTAPGDKAE
ncbi:MAG: hypothetical protein ABJ308_01955 [Halieaceae bacterium]